MSFVYITEEGARIQKKGGKFLVGRNLEILFEIPEEVLEGLVLIGSVQVSSQAMVELLRLGIPVTWISGTGKFFGRLESTSHVNVFRQQKQIVLQDTPVLFALAKQVIMAKVHNQITVLRQYNRRADNTAVKADIENIQRIRKNIQFAADKKELMGYEGNIRKIYYESWNILIDQDINFEKRVKNPPDNMINTLISYVNTLVYTKVLSAIYNTQLNPTVSYLHEPGSRRFSLSLDIAEIFKPIIGDRLIFSLLNKKQITEKSFTKDLNYLHLTKEASRTIVAELDKKLQTTIKHKELNKNVSYEYLMKLECYKLIKHLLGEKEYEPFKIWW